MRIALFHNLLAGGAKRALYEYARELRSRRHHLDAFTLATGDEAFLPLAPVTERVHVEPVTLPGLLETRLLPFVLQYWNLRRRLGAFEALDAAHARVAERIDAGGYDVAFVHPDYLVKAPFLLRHLRTPSVYYCYEPLRRYYEYTAPPPPPASWKGRVRAAWYAPVEPLYEGRHKRQDAENTRAAKLLVTSSLYACESIRRAYGLTAHVARLGVDTERFKPVPMPREHAVVSVGRFQENKNQALIIEALARLEASRRPKLILVGESSGTAAYRDGLVAQARAQNVTLELLEDASDADLVAAYNRARLNVFTPILEPFGFVPLEAAACGTPSVGVHEAGVRETIRHDQTGLLVAPEPGAVASAIATLLADDARREAMGARALDDVRTEWTWQRSAEAIERLFAQVVGES
ncbi:MAG TPA: glycosyltransferase family 4 protein [Oscillatoriaceae cyanobacterium]